MKLCFLALLLGSALADDWLVKIEMEDCWECGSDSTEVHVTVIGDGGKKFTVGPLLNSANNYKSGGKDYFKIINGKRISKVECIEINIKSGTDAWKFKKIVLHSRWMKDSEWPTFVNRLGHWMSADESEGVNFMRICLDKCQDDLPITNEKWELHKTIYHKGTEDLIVYRPENVAQIRVDARYSSVDQISQFVAEKEITVSSTFEKTTGASITVGTTFSTGFPGIANGEVNMELGLSQDFSWGEETSTAKKVGSTYICTAAAGKLVVCKATLYMGMMDIRYTQIWKTKDSKKSWCRIETGGIFREVASVRMDMVAKEV